MRQILPYLKNKTAPILCAALLVTGCGGGGGGSSGGGDGDTTSSTPNTKEFSPDCSGAKCGASGNSYTGNGVGIWRYTNSGSGTQRVNATLQNVKNKDITVILTNETPNSISFAPPSQSVALPKYSQAVEDETDRTNHIPQIIRDFDVTPLLVEGQNDEGDEDVSVRNIQKSENIGDVRSWLVQPKNTFESRSTKLVKQSLLNGWTINFWIEQSEAAKVSDALLNDMKNTFTSMYSTISDTAGKPWGTQPYSGFITANEKTVNIVFVNFDNDHSPYGLMGYFWSLNNFKKSAGSCNIYASTSSELLKCSNEALVVFIDTETLYLDGLRGENSVKSTLAHEFTHLVSFYERSLKLQVTDEVFFGEMTAMMMEDIVADKTDPLVIFHDIKDRHKRWLIGDHNCDFINWDSTACSSVYNYSSAGSFGAYLLRTYGIDFYKKLLKKKENGTAGMIGKVIKEQSSSDNFSRAVQRWGASIALIPSNIAPAKFGYPERYESGITLYDFDDATNRALPSSWGTLNAYGHYAVARQSSSDTFSEEFRVPSGVSVTIVVKNP